MVNQSDVYVQILCINYFVINANNLSIPYIMSSQYYLVNDLPLAPLCKGYILFYSTIVLCIVRYRGASINPKLVITN